MSTIVSLDGVKAVKVQINVTARDGFTGVHAAGRWWEEGVNEAILESDPNATGKPVTDENSGAVLPIYTLETKLNQLYILEGRRRLDNGKWTEPRFPLPDQSDSTNKKPPALAPAVIKLKVIDRQLNDGSWESEKRAHESAAATKTSSKPAEQRR